MMSELNIENQYCNVVKYVKLNQFNSNFAYFSILVVGIGIIYLFIGCVYIALRSV